MNLIFNTGIYMYIFRTLRRSWDIEEYLLLLTAFCWLFLLNRISNFNLQMNGFHTKMSNSKPTPKKLLLYKPNCMALSNRDSAKQLKEYRILRRPTLSRSKFSYYISKNIHVQPLFCSITSGLWVHVWNTFCV